MTLSVISDTAVVAARVAIDPDRLEPEKLLILGMKNDLGSKLVTKVI